MQIVLFVEGRLGEFMAANAKAAQEGARRGLRRITGGIRTGIRNAVKRGGFRAPLERLVVSSVKGEGIDQTGEVRSVAVYGAGSTRRRRVDLIKLYSEGASITAKSGRLLAIPSGEAPLTRGRGRARQMTPAEMQAAGMQIRVVPWERGKAVVIWTRGGQETLTHVLVPRVTLRKRYDYRQVVRRWEARYGPVMAEEINRAADRRPILRGR